MPASSHSIRRRAVLALLGVAAILAAVLVSGAAAGSSSNGPPQTRVYGGGNIPIGSCTDGATTFCTPVTREFSILAIHDPNEDLTYGTITFGRGTTQDVVRVTCLAISGNVAEVGGVIVQDTVPSLVGDTYEVFLRDSGQPGTGSRDGVSPVFADVPPPAKPSCGDLSSGAFGLGFFTLTYGDISVENVGNQNS
jgi:hypothetical protein